MEDTKQRFEKGLIFYRSAAHGNGVRCVFCCRNGKKVIAMIAMNDVRGAAVRAVWQIILFLSCIFSDTLSVSCPDSV